MHLRFTFSPFSLLLMMFDVVQLFCGNISHLSILIKWCYSLLTHFRCVVCVVFHYLCFVLSSYCVVFHVPIHKIPTKWREIYVWLSVSIFHHVLFGELLIQLPFFCAFSSRSLLFNISRVEKKKKKFGAKRECRENSHYIWTDNDCNLSSSKKKREKLSEFFIPQQTQHRRWGSFVECLAAR